MRKAPLRIRIGRKAAQIADMLLGRSVVRSDSGPTAPAFMGPKAISAVSEIAVVNACVMRKALDKSRVPLRVGRVDKKGTFTPLAPSSSEDDPQYLLASINPTEGPASFFARAFAMQQLSGDLFAQVEYLHRSKPRELWLLQSDRMDIVKGADRRVRQYEYTLDDKVTKFAPEQVFHSRLPHPANDWRGLSPLKAAERWAWIEDQLSRFHSNVVTRGGVPPGFVSFKEYVEVPEREKLRESIRNMYGGPQAAGQMGVLWGDADFVNTGQSASDGQYLELDDRSVRKVASVFGVPLILLMDLSDASYANAVQQVGSYWKQTIIPELDLFAQDYTKLVLWRLYKDRSLVAKYDYSGVEALQELRLVRAESLTRLVSGGIMTQNEARAEIGLAPATGGDQLYAPQILQPTGSVALSPAARVAPARVGAKWIDDPVRHEKRAKVGAALDVFEAESLKEVNLARVRSKARFLNALRASEKAAKAPIDDFFEMDVEIDQTNAVLVRLYSRIGSNRGQSAMDEAIEDERFAITNPRAQRWIEETAGSQSKRIAETLKDGLASELAAANAEGLTLQETITRMAEWFDGLETYENLRIARTETARAYNFATDEGYRQSGVVEAKEWLTAGDEHVRSFANGDAFDHAGADGETVPIDGVFVISGETLAFPGDPAGSPGNTINCRCSIAPVIDQAKAARRRALRAVKVPDLALDQFFLPEKISA